MLPRFRALTAASCAVSSFVLLAVGCSDGKSSGPTSADKPAAIVPVTASSVVEQPDATGGESCTSLGSIDGTAFTAQVGASAEWFWARVTGRGDPIKLGIIASGSPADLKGRTVELGKGVNADYATCTHCLPMAVGCTDEACSGGRWFFPRAGTAIFTELAANPGETFAGQFKDVVLREVTIDAQTNQVKDVAGGACYSFASISFRATYEGDSGLVPATDGGPTLLDAADDGTTWSDPGAANPNSGGKSLDSGLGIGTDFR